MVDSPIRVSFTLPTILQGPIRHIWQDFTFRFEIPYVETTEGPDVQLVYEDAGDISISADFARVIAEQVYDPDPLFPQKPLFYCKNGKPDFLGTAFYMMQGLQEYPSSFRDELGRYDPKHSYQEKFDSYTKNLVDEYFKRILFDLPILHRRAKMDRPSYVFLSQDVDLIDASLRQEFLAALRRGEISKSVRSLVQHLTGHATYLDMTDIMDMQAQRGYSSTFFWLPINRGYQFDRQTEINNADYIFTSQKIQSEIDRIIERGFSIGLHKSVGRWTFDQEIDLFRQSIVANRNHFLLFNLPQHYRDLSTSNIQLDCSLGYSRKIGFRNSYGWPFVPYDIHKNAPCDVLEIPLHIMDASFLYEKTPDMGMIEQTIQAFINNHKNNAVISILWHNHTFSKIKFPAYRNLYEKILGWLSEHNIKGISQDELLAWKEKRMSRSLT